MIRSRTSKIAVIGLSILLLCVVVVSVIYFPLISAIIFISLVAVFALQVGRKKDGISGFFAFIKDALFGW